MESSGYLHAEHADVRGRRPLPAQPACPASTRATARRTRHVLRVGQREAARGSDFRQPSCQIRGPEVEMRAQALQSRWHVARSSGLQEPVQRASKRAGSDMIRWLHGQQRKIRAAPDPMRGHNARVNMQHFVGVPNDVTAKLCAGPVHPRVVSPALHRKARPQPPPSGTYRIGWPTVGRR